MPRIPQIKGRTRLSPGNPVGFQSTSAARQTGETISQLGAIAGQTITQFSLLEDRIAADTKNAILHEKESQITSASEQAFFEAGQEVKADGSDLIALYDTKLDAKIKEGGILDDVEEGVLERQLQKSILNNRTSSLSALRPLQIKLSGDEVVRRTGRILGMRTSNVRLDPSLHNEEKEFYNLLIKQSRILSSRQKKDALELARSEFASARIDGLVNDRQFGAARDAVLIEFGSVFKGGAGQAKIDSINAKQLKIINRQAAIESLARSRSKEELRVQQVGKLAELTAAALEPDQTKLELLAHRESILEEIKSQGITTLGGSKLDTKINKDLRFIDATNAQEIKVMLSEDLTPLNLDQIDDKITVMEAKGDLLSKTAGALRATVGKQRLALKDKEFRRWFKALLVKTLPIDIIERRLDAESLAVRKYSAESDYRTFYNRSRNAEEAYNKTIQKHFPGIKGATFEPFFGIIQDFSDIKKGNAKLDTARQLNVISASRFRELKDILKNTWQRLKNEEILKGFKPFPLTEVLIPDVLEESTIIPLKRTE